MIPATPADKFPSSRFVDETETEAGKPAQATTQRGPGAVSSTYVDSRTALDREAAQRDTSVRDPEADVPKVDPIPEIPGLFIFTTEVYSRKKGKKIDRVELLPISGGMLRSYNSFMIRRIKTTRDEITKSVISEDTSYVDFDILMKFISSISGLDPLEVDKISGFDMMRLNIKIQDMMYNLPPT